MSKAEGLYEIREFRPTDTSFIMATFLRGLYYGDSWFSLIPKNIFMETYSKVAEALIKAPTTSIQIACLKEDKDVILGYSLLSSDFQTIIWVQVKKEWRNVGIAKALVPARPVAVSHLTKVGKTLLPKLNGAIFNPFYIP